MGVFDKAKHQAEELVGKAKEAAGERTGNEDLANEGRKEQFTGRTKQWRDKLKDTFRR